MTLIKSISGIRGTIGGKAGDNLTPRDIVDCTAAFGHWLARSGRAPKVVIGRDGRVSGPMVSRLAANTLVGMGVEVIDLGLSTTPTAAVATPLLKAGGAIVVTASHNPENWNALKFLNQHGEFISAAEGRELLSYLAEEQIVYAPVEGLGAYRRQDGFIKRHIELVLALPLVDVEAVRRRGFKVVVDAVNSTGALAIPPLLEELGCETILLNGEVNGRFAHNPEPLPEHLGTLSARVRAENADLGVAVDPDVDRLALVMETGEMFGEEYTLVAAADYVLRHRTGPTVSNLSSTRALRDLTRQYGAEYHAAAVGEVNVVEKMKAVGAVIGGEGNGGVIVPELHYGRDALAGLALFLSHLATSGKTASQLKAGFPAYVMVKDKIALSDNIDLNRILGNLAKKYRHEELNQIDGLKIDFPESWVHLRKSNTEPIIRIYAEGRSEAEAQRLVEQIKNDLS